MTKNLKGTLTVLTAGSLWGTMSLFINYLSKTGLQIMQTVFLRMLITAVLMLITLVIYKPSLLKIRLKDIWCFFGNGILSLLTFSFCYFNAIQITGAATAAVLLYTAPVIVMILSIFLFKEKLTFSKSIACILAVTGCVFSSGLIGSGEVISAKGLLFGLGAGFCYALYSIFTRFAINKGYNTLTVIFYSFTIGLIGTLFLIDIPSAVTVVVSSGKTLAIVIIMGLATSILPYLLYTYGLSQIESSKASIIASVEPVVATIIGYFVLKQNLTVFSVIGIVLVLSSLFILSIKTKSK